MLLGFLGGLRAHLAPGGRGALLLSDLAELLGLREPGFLDAQLAASGLTRLARFDAAAKHGKARDASDPLHRVRAREVTTLHVLAPTGS
jgi:hypothetical protein